MTHVQRTHQEEIDLARAKMPALMRTVETAGIRPMYKYRRPVACSLCHQPKAGPRPYHPSQKHDEDHRPTERGGTTVCTLLDPDGAELATGLARCLPTERFVYLVGKAYALERALAQYLDRVFGIGEEDR